MPATPLIDDRRVGLEALPDPRPRRRSPARAASGDVPRADWTHVRTPAEAWPLPPVHPPSLLDGLSVLIVDDDEDTAMVFAAALTLCGAAVTTAMSASDALRLLGAIRPAVVVSDIAMPQRDGYWLVRQIQESADETLRVPVIATTAYGREHSRARALAAGFSDHLRKPVDPEMLCRAVAKAAGR